MGAQVGGMIKEYGLNKQKKEKATNEVEGILELYPEYATQLTSSGDETSDKKNQNTLDKLKKGELGLSGLEGLLGKFARMERKDDKELQDDTRRTLLETQKLALTSARNTQNVVKSTAEDSLALIKEVKEIEQQLNESGLPFKPTPAIARLLAEEDRYKIASKSGNPTFLPKPGDPTTDELNRLQIGAAEQGAEAFEAMGGVAGQVKRLEEDRELQKLQVLGLYHARVNMGKSSPATVPIQKILSEEQKELDRMGSLKTTLKGDDDKSLSVIDIIEVKPNREIGLKEEYDLTKMDDVTRNNFQLFLTQSGKVQDAQRQMPVELKRIFNLTEFGDQLVEVGREVEMGDGKTGRVVSIENGKVNVIYEGTLYEKNSQDTEALQREEAARVEEQRKSIPQIRSDFERAGGSVKFGQSKL